MPVVARVAFREVSMMVIALGALACQPGEDDGGAGGGAEGGDTVAPAPAPHGDTPAGMNPALYQYRPPIDLTNARLRKMAAALGPAYVRVSGTWANTTYFPNSASADTAPPPGFGACSRAVARGHRLRASHERRDRHVVRDRYRRARRERRVETRPRAPLGRVHARRRRQDRRSRAHERAHAPACR